MWWRWHNGVWVILSTQVRVRSEMDIVCSVKWYGPWASCFVMVIINWNIFLFSIRRQTIFCHILTMARSMEMTMMMQMKAQFTEELTERGESTYILFARKKRNTQENSVIIPARKELPCFFKGENSSVSFLTKLKTSDSRFLFKVWMEDNCLKDAGVICTFAAGEEHLLCDVVNEINILYLSLYRKFYSF